MMSPKRRRPILVPTQPATRSFTPEVNCSCSVPFRTPRTRERWPSSRPGRRPRNSLTTTLSSCTESSAPTTYANGTRSSPAPMGTPPNLVGTRRNSSHTGSGAAPDTPHDSARVDRGRDVVGASTSFGGGQAVSARDALSPPDTARPVGRQLGLGPGPRPPHALGDAHRLVGRLHCPDLGGHPGRGGVRSSVLGLVGGSLAGRGHRGGGVGAALASSVRGPQRPVYRNRVEERAGPVLAPPPGAGLRMCRARRLRVDPLPRRAASGLD